MNIKEAKEQIKNAMTAYFSRDEYGYEISVEKQRPVFLMGPPGIGKTAIMEQIAGEMGVGLVSYSMTHHTRQSALGLPFIVHKNYSGMECDVSEYTMSEIIASVYDMMEDTGVQEGILFLDEINCVSETLSPVMLQFLQYKIFGRHRVPDGWVVVTAGNPPEYNNSVREFDIVTWDRLKRIDVEPDFDVWKEYAYERAIHPAVITYLEIKKDNFYRIESTVDGKRFVTARGWEDLSRMIQVYEKHDLKVDEKLVRQYLQNPKIAKDFAVYYDLFNKYRSDYQVSSILDGKASDAIKDRAKAAKFDERLALLGLILDAVVGELRAVVQREEVTLDLMAVLKTFKTAVVSSRSGRPAEQLDKQIKEQRAQAASGKKSGSISEDQRRQKLRLIAVLEDLALKISGEDSGAAAFQTVKGEFDAQVKGLQKSAQSARKQLSNVFKFCEEVFAGGQEMLILVTELTINSYASKFIGRYGCPEYFAHNKELLFYERQQDIITELEKLDLDED